MLKVELCKREFMRNANYTAKLLFFFFFSLYKGRDWCCGFGVPSSF